MLKQEEIIKLFNDFKLAWDDYSRRFQAFWKEKILNPQVKELNDAEIDDIIRILDRNAKGNTGKVD
jgi:hypothetical protein